MTLEPIPLSPLETLFALGLWVAYAFMFLFMCYIFYKIIKGD